MNVLFVSQNFPPEVNALANRVSHTTRHWVERGTSVEVLTDVPCYPEGKVHEGYRNRFQREEQDGVAVTRVPLITVENRGALRRLALYLSFMVSAVWYSRKLRYEPDVLIGTTPHLFNALAAYVISRMRGVPFVLEVRDLWPESVVETGVLPEDHLLVRAAEWIVGYLYDRADHLVVVTETFRERLASDFGVKRDRVTFIPNGADLALFDRELDDHELNQLREKLDLEGKFVASYLGTVGAAHGADVLFEAARISDDPELVFMVVGAGARWEALQRLQREAELANFRLVPRQPRERMPYFLGLSDVSVIHLRDVPVFGTVLPSKIFEAMATGTPIVLGVRGESQELVCEDVGCGVFAEPENASDIVEKVRSLKQAPARYCDMASRGRRAARERFSRVALSDNYLSTLKIVVGKGD